MGVGADANSGTRSLNVKYTGIVKLKTGGLKAIFAFANRDHIGMDALHMTAASLGAELFWATTESGRVIFNG